MQVINRKYHHGHSLKLGDSPRTVNFMSSPRRYFTWRPLAGTLLLGVIVATASLANAQQQPSSVQTQMPQAVQLPSSGRTMESNGSVTSEQKTASGVGAGVVQPLVSVTGDYRGSISGLPVPAGTIRLSLIDAVKRGLRANLGVIRAGVLSSMVDAERAQARSELLPQITASLGATETQINLAAYGLNQLGGAFGSGAYTFPTIVGPFQYVQGQGNFSWNGLSLTNLRNFQAAGNVDRAVHMDERGVREAVVLAVGGTYLQVIASAARVAAQRAQVKYAQATYDRATTQLIAGTNTRVDATRSLVQLQSEKERLLAFESEYQQQKIAFARLIGLPQSADIVFTEKLSDTKLQLPDEASALHAALEHRWGLRAAAAQVKAGEEALSAARAERLPSLSFDGHYGAIGPRPNDSHGVFAVTGTLNIPIFDGGRISSDVRHARATLRQRRSEYEDEKGKVEQDVRDALIQLRTAMGQVQLAKSNRQYALETLRQVEDRFNAGVTNTVEVVQAEQQEAGAENDYISSLFALNLARLNLARATGDAEGQLANLFPNRQH